MALFFIVLHCALGQNHVLKVSHQGRLFKMQHLSQALVTHTFNPKIWEREPGAPLILRPAWSVKQVPGQTGLLHRETLCQPPPQKRKEAGAGEWGIQHLVLNRDPSIEISGGA